MINSHNLFALKNKKEEAGGNDMKFEWKSQDHKKRSIEYIQDMFRLYNECDSQLRKGIRQNLTANYNQIIVSGGRITNSVEEQIITLADCERYIKYVDSILQTLPDMHRRIMIDRFIRGRKHMWIYMDLQVPESTYFRMYDECIMMFMAEETARRAEKRNLGVNMGVNR